VDARTDCAGHRSESVFPACGWIFRDKRLDVVSGRRTSVDKGRHETRSSLIERGRSTTDVYVCIKHHPPAQPRQDAAADNEYGRGSRTYANEIVNQSPKSNASCFVVRDRTGHALGLRLFRGRAGPQIGGEAARAMRRGA
jgi:hypothetical protein